MEDFSVSEYGIDKSDSPSLAEAQRVRVLFILTSHDKLGRSDFKTGCWLEELAAPYGILTESGIEVVLASPEGGEAPIDPESLLPQHLTPYTEKFCLSEKARKQREETLPLREVKEKDFDALFCPGGRGLLFDLVRNLESIRLIEAFSDAGKPIAFVCHSPALLKHVQDRRGNPLVAGRRVTCIRDSEEAGSALTRMLSFIPPRFLKLINILTYPIGRLPAAEYFSLLRLWGIIPFLTSRILKKRGGRYVCKKNWKPFLVEDFTDAGGFLITGQNHASAILIGERLAEILTDDEAFEEDISTNF